ncbi:3-phosphoshikimate 1-carboxyvinyltransferase [Caproiciproducens faecalis]|uniref:3-phosphoshikimate 1-carboxyvinyltransferase n=1 Tax=Caproiciproducens faecalis TaxID=2820301 RepID=A0ABS7DMR9_9FIRM|nr:3-phosphoshikimate 1-carboxyvinyltransferase [Caproiciproducens faecalis]MBW7572595.1 3-phosphoshikimate 1-carboxyvinyltransferase [Caproiciproducens faecalis]
MANVLITPSVLSGNILVPPSKSAAHRAAICSALAGGKPLFDGEALSNDITATCRAMRAICGGGKAVQIDCGESGSTLRFLIPVAAALGLNAEFIGSGRLPERPIGVYLDCLPRHGVLCNTQGGLPLTVSGQMTPGRFELPGNISSQFITGLLLALPLLNGDSELVLSSPLESAGYVDMTIEIMREFGVTVQRAENGWNIPGRQKYRPCEYRVERDWSQAAFFLAAGTLGGTLRLEGLNPDSCQGDRAAEQLFREFGARVEWEGSVLSVSPKELTGIEIDASQIPDLVPVLAATAALCRGCTRIYNAQRLRIKESDRLFAMADGLTKLGGKVVETPDGLIIDGVPLLHGGKAEGFNDHRIVMALSIAALKADGGVTVSDAQSIEKSYPAFFEDYNRLGGKANVFHMG